jgi:hypothetical protein
LHILHQAHADVFHIAHASDLPRLFTGLAEYREQNGGEDRDYRDHDQQLNEGEATPKRLTRHHRPSPPLAFFVGMLFARTKIWGGNGKDARGR